MYGPEYLKFCSGYCAHSFAADGTRRTAISGPRREPYPERQSYEPGQSYAWSRG